MCLSACAIVAVAALGAAPPSTLPADGVYVVLRDSLAKKDVLPLKYGESLVVHRHRYQAKDEVTPPRFVVVRPTPDVRIDLDGKPRPIKNGTEVVGINLKLRPEAAQALERATTRNRGGQVVIVLAGEIVTMHKIREPIRGGDVQITSCAPRAAAFLLKHLEDRRKD